MKVKRAIGRPLKVNMRTVTKLADALQHSATVSDACRYAKISRTTYYYYLSNEPFFAEAMNTAKANQYRPAFNLLTPC